jgi:hypothetical protein
MEREERERRGCSRLGKLEGRKENMKAITETKMKRNKKINHIQ